MEEQFVKIAVATIVCGLGWYLTPPGTFGVLRFYRDMDGRWRVWWDRP